MTRELIFTLRVRPETDTLPNGTIQGSYTGMEIFFDHNTNL